MENDYTNSELRTIEREELKINILKPWPVSQYFKVVSCKIFSHFGFRIQQLGSTLSGCHFAAKTSQNIWYGSTRFNSGGGFPDPD
jgi:hypothetical protein